MPADWLVAKNQKQSGPFTSADLRQMAASGQLRPDDLIWKEGMPEWVPASRIKGLFSKAAATSPPNEETAAPPIPVSNRLSLAIGRWRQISTPAKIGIVSACAGLLLIVSCSGLLTLQGYSARLERERDQAESRRNEEEDRKELQELVGHIELGHSLWNDGKKTEAVTEYKRAINHRGRFGPMFFSEAGDADKPTVLQRTIEYELANANTSAADQLIKNAVNHSVTIHLDSPDGNFLVELATAEFRARREESDRKRAQAASMQFLGIEGNLVTEAEYRSQQKRRTKMSGREITDAELDSDIRELRRGNEIAQEAARQNGGEMPGFRERMEKIARLKEENQKRYDAIMRDPEARRKATAFGDAVRRGHAQQGKK